MGPESSPGRNTKNEKIRHKVKGNRTDKGTRIIDLSDSEEVKVSEEPVDAEKLLQDLEQLRKDVIRSQGGSKYSE